MRNTKGIKRLLRISACLAGICALLTMKQNNQEDFMLLYTKANTVASPETRTFETEADVITSVVTTESAVLAENQTGWHENADRERYYIDKSGKKKIGYFKVSGSHYYAKKNGMIVTDQWKYIKIDGRKYKLYFGDNGKQKQNVSAILGEQKQYRLEVNIQKNVVIVYAKDENGEYCIPVKAMICSCGVPGHSTITGNYSYLRKTGKWHTLYYGTYGKYCTRISGPYLFHSVVYSRNGDDYSLYADEFEKLGKAASHGCVRLQVKDAKWIYNHSSKCSAYLYRDNKQLPLKKPIAADLVELENGKVCDPTDTDVN